MQNSVIKNRKSAFKTAWRAIKKFFSETFRARSSRDYREFFVRGLASRSGENMVYPWLWARVFALGLILFAAVTALAKYTGNSIGYPTAIFFGGGFANLTFLVLLYELYPQRNLSFTLLIGVMVVGAVCADAIIQLVYFVCPVPASRWLELTEVAIVEEAGKAIPALLAIFIMGRKSPAFGFVLAAAVGAGVSITEDMGYIFGYASGYLTVDYSTVVEIAVSRGITAFCTHTLWTAVIGWAFCKFRRPLINLKFWSVCISSAALHYLWDIPTSEIGNIARGFLTAGCTLTAIIFSVCVVAVERRTAFVKDDSVQMEIVLTDNKNKIRNKRRALSHAANLTATLSLCVLATLSLIACSADWGWVGYTEHTYGTAEEFIDFMQDGVNVNADFGRKYDSATENSYELVENGKLINAVQAVTGTDGRVYNYSYNFGSEYGETGELDYVGVEIDGLIYNSQFFVLDEEGENRLYFFVFNQYVYRYFYDIQAKLFTVRIQDRNYKGLTESIVLGASAAFVFATGCITFVTLKLISYKNKREEIKNA